MVNAESNIHFNPSSTALPFQQHVWFKGSSNDCQTLTLYPSVSGILQAFWPLIHTQIGFNSTYEQASNYGKVNLVSVPPSVREPHLCSYKIVNSTRDFHHVALFCRNSWTAACLCMPMCSSYSSTVNICYYFWICALTLLILSNTLFSLLIS